MRRPIHVILLAAVLPLVSGCNWLIPLIMVGEHKRKVPAEFTKLVNQNVLVLVWAQPETLFDFPRVRLETSTYIRDELAAKLKTHNISADFVDPARVEDFLQRSLEATSDPVALGRKFDASMVVYLELLQFQIRDSDAPDYLRGKVHASVAVYDLTAAADETQRYELEPVTVRFPDGQPVMINPTATLRVHQGTYEVFAQTVARKFYDYEEDLETVDRPRA